MATETEPTFSAQRLEEQLKVVAYANRIRLLAMLREPHTLDEIRIEPGPSKAGSRPTRPIARQSVAYHLDQLMEAGLVRARPTKREGRKTLHEFSVEQANLYALVEEFRLVSTFTSKAPTAASETVMVHERPRQAWESGPKLILVHGVYEGRAYGLRGRPRSPGRGWIIGRAPHCEISLGYDPFVSAENTELLQTSRGVRLLDLRTSRNGTYVNWNRLPPGGETELEAGDVIGVGRSLLVYRPT